MPIALTEVDTFTGSVAVPAGADNRTAASVETPFQALTNRSRYLLNRLPGAMASYTFDVPLVPRYAGASSWIDGILAGWPGGTGGPYWVQANNTTATGDSLIFQLTLPTTIGKIHSIAATVDGRSPHPGSPGAHAGLPAQMPRIQLMRDFAATIVATSTDASASLGVYENQHEIVIPALAHTILPTSTYFIRVLGESGANSLANSFDIRRLVVEITP